MFLWSSLEGYGDVLQDSGSGKEGDTERAILQAALWFTRLFYFSIAG